MPASMPMQTRRGKPPPSLPTYATLCQLVGMYPPLCPAPPPGQSALQGGGRPPSLPSYTTLYLVITPIRVFQGLSGLRNILPMFALCFRMPKPVFCCLAMLTFPADLFTSCICLLAPCPSAVWMHKWMHNWNYHFSGYIYPRI